MPPVAGRPVFEALKITDVSTPDAKTFKHLILPYCLELTAPLFNKV